MKKLHYIVILVLLVLFTGCGLMDQQGIGEQGGDIYTCPMHPTVKSSTPGSCPVCNMSLVKVDKKNNGQAAVKGNLVSVGYDEKQFAGIRTDTVKRREIIPANSLLGTVTIDDEQVKTVSSRVSGRIDHLAVKADGVHIQKGQLLYRIYSEELQADQKDYLALLGKVRGQDKLFDGFRADLTASAKNKLLLWGLTERQIKELERSGRADPLVSFFSPESGYVKEVSVTEGSYVQEGSPLIKIARLNQVWVEAQAYASELPGLNTNEIFRIFSESAPEDTYMGRLVYNNPGIEQGKRIYLLKIRIDNPDKRLIPGTLVRVSRQVAAFNTLAVPKTAVLHDRMTTVWIWVHDNTYEQRAVETGKEDKYWVEILSGIKAGEIIVSDGAYLLNSQFILANGAVHEHTH